ncbi:DJ-1 [Choiromyces venosus 120613-1]|uniref:D-lactate dehydratase n=1 Tax=Choiromyces venosus 120613-1 TaxID=1336337 RepID=A0A3N4JU34_9PEZI|nr:DJ-1 [Choiromyces venosus 120613-1]
MVKKAFVLVADGSEEIEFVTVYDGETGFEYVFLLSRGVKIIPDIQNLDPEAQLPNLIVLPGGAPGAKAFEESNAVSKFINRAHNEGVYIGAICAATKALVRFGAEGGWKAKVTSHPSVQEAVVKGGWEYAQDRVVIDGKVITSRGPGTSLLFALTLVETLCGREKREEVEGPMITASEL